MSAVRRALHRGGEAVGNPVLVREFRVRMRGIRGSLLLLLYVGMVSAVALAVIGIRMGGAGVVAQDAMGEWSRGTLAAILITQCCLLTAVLPGMLGAGIALERQSQTLEQLVITPLRSAHIVIGKYGAAMVQVGYLVLATVPVAGVCFLMGGVSWDVLLPGLALCVSSALGVGAMALYCSTLFRSPVSGIVLAYVVTVGYNLVLPIGELTLREFLRGAVSPEPVSVAVVPWLSLVGLVHGDTMPAGRGLPPSLWWLSASGFSVLAAIGFLFLAVARLGASMRGRLPG